MGLAAALGQGALRDQWVGCIHFYITALTQRPFLRFLFLWCHGFSEKPRAIISHAFGRFSKAVQFFPAIAGALQSQHSLLENFAPVLVIPKLIKTRASG